MSDPEFLRIGTKERDEALKVLGDHFAEGRLPVAEYDERVSKTFEAETRADLKPLFSDLPPPHPAFLSPPPPPAPFAPPPAYGPPPAYAPRREIVPQGERYKLAAGLLQIMLPFGIGRFYLGYNRMALTQLLLVPLGVGIVWCLIDGIMLLVQSVTDPRGPLAPRDPHD